MNDENLTIFDYSFDQTTRSLVLLTNGDQEGIEESNTSGENSK